MIDRDALARQAFETWFGDPRNPRAIERNSDGGYLLLQANYAWNAWHPAWRIASSAARAEALEEAANLIDSVGFADDMKNQALTFVSEMIRYLAKTEPK
jgi:hypothetical protein